MVGRGEKDNKKYKIKECLAMPCEQHQYFDAGVGSEPFVQSGFGVGKSRV
jgi:hypothetical protein